MVLIPKQERDLWTRLGLLSERCRIEMHAGRVRPGAELHWELTIQPRDDGHAVPVRVCRRGLTEAIAEALEEARARGWPAQLAPAPARLTQAGLDRPGPTDARGAPPDRGLSRYDPADGTA